MHCMYTPASSPAKSKLLGHLQFMDSSSDMQLSLSCEALQLNLEYKKTQADLPCICGHTHTCIVPHIHTSYEYKNQACIEDHAIECPQKSPRQRQIKVYFTANTSTAAADVSYSREPFIQTQQQQSQNMATWCFQSWFIEGALAFSFICLVLMLLLVVSSQIITGYSICYKIQ